MIVTDIQQRTFAGPLIFGAFDVLIARSCREIATSATTKMVSRKINVLVVVSLIAGVLATLAGCDRGSRYHRHLGSTMGTYYAVTYAGAASCAGELSEVLEDELDAVNAQMSTYLPESELSRFNASNDLDWVDVSIELAQTIAVAHELSEQSQGAFDVTVGPLVNVWGFGPEERTEPPTAEEVALALTRVGYDKLMVDVDRSALRKQHVDLYVDLSAIAKGHGVDRLAAVLDRHGCEHFLVDIGGEVRTRGHNASGSDWRVGIEVPDGSGSIQRVLYLSGQAVATSGDYRNFRVESGSRFSHTIDPRLGRPVNHDLVSVTVVAERAELADGYATLISVLGAESGLRFASDRHLAVFLIVRQEAGFEERYTAPMTRYLPGLK